MAAHGVHSYLPGDPDTAMAAPCRSWLIINFYIRRNNWNESSPRALTARGSPVWARQSARFAGGYGPLGEAEHVSALGMLSEVAALVGWQLALWIQPLARNAGGTSRALGGCGQLDLPCGSMIPSPFDVIAPFVRVRRE